MGSKSYVTMEQHECVLCGHMFDTGALLMDRRLRESFEPHTKTGMGVCNTCKTSNTGLPLEEYDHVAILCASDVQHTRNRRNQKVVESANLTGDVAFLRRGVAAEMFDIDTSQHDFVFCEPEVLTYLKQIEGASHVEQEVHADSDRQRPDASRETNGDGE